MNYGWLVLCAPNWGWVQRALVLVEDPGGRKMVLGYGALPLSQIDSAIEAIH